MISEEQIISNLKNRKRRIIVISFLIVVCLIVILSSFAASQRALKTIEDDIPIPIDVSRIDEKLLLKNIPGLFQDYGELSQIMALSSFHASRIYALGNVFSIFLGLLTGLLIYEIVGQTRNRLIVEMWERLNKLEKNV